MSILIGDEDYKENNNFIMEEDEVILNRYDRIGEAQKAYYTGYVECSVTSSINGLI